MLAKDGEIVTLRDMCPDWIRISDHHYKTADPACGATKKERPKKEPVEHKSGHKSRRVQLRSDRECLVFDDYRQAAAFLKVDPLRISNASRTKYLLKRMWAVSYLDD